MDRRYGAGGSTMGGASTMVTGSVGDMVRSRSSLHTLETGYTGYTGLSTPLLERRLKKKRQSAWKDFTDWVYWKHPVTGTPVVMGRTPWNWAWVGLFYFIFYGTLLFVTGAILLFFNRVYLDSDYPILQMERSRIGYHSPTPGLSIRPMPHHRSSLIRFISGAPETYKPYVDDIRAFMANYDIQPEAVNCRDHPPTLNYRQCYFELPLLGDRCHFRWEYGYRYGRPCVLLKLNKMYGWMPDMNYTASEQARLPSEYRTRFDSRFVGVTCQGRTEIDRENLGEILYWPPQGFNKNFYPYRNQLAYLSPVVMVEFRNVTNGIMVQVECIAHARNIEHVTEGVITDVKRGSVRFELMID